MQPSEESWTAPGPTMRSGLTGRRPAIMLRRRTICDNGVKRMGRCAMLLEAVF
jgi:hypothetical protein